MCLPTTQTSAQAQRKMKRDRRDRDRKISPVWGSKSLPYQQSTQNLVADSVMFYAFLQRLGRQWKFPGFPVFKTAEAARQVLNGRGRMARTLKSYCILLLNTLNWKALQTATNVIPISNPIQVKKPKKKKRTPRMNSRLVLDYRNCAKEEWSGAIVQVNSWIKVDARVGKAERIPCTVLRMGWRAQQCSMQNTDIRMTLLAVC